MLSERFQSCGGRIVSRDSWKPFPRLRDRASWEALPAELRAAYAAEGERALAAPWPVLTATRYLDFFRDGNRSRYEEPYFRRRGMLRALVAAECTEGKGRFLDAAADGLWLLCEESSWCLPAHIGQAGEPDLTDGERHVVDLFAAETAAQLAWSAYLLGDALDGVSPRIRRRLEREIESRVLAPCVARDDFHWLGLHGRKLNNWTPWICSNWLTAALLTDADPARRETALRRILETLDRFLSRYPADGGCDEGPQYWNRAGAALLDCLELLHSATEGRLDAYGEPLVREIGRYILRAWIADDWFVNFADAPAVLSPEPWPVFRYGQRIGDRGLQGFGSWIARRRDLGRSCLDADWGRTPGMGRLLSTLFHLGELLGEGDPAPGGIPEAPRDAWLPDIQVMTARDAAADCGGFFVAAKGGHNAESHNHNDVGSFLVFLDGKPLFVDAGVETYTRKTFGPSRYEIWTMQSSWHTLLPSFDGTMQEVGRESAARDVRYRADAERAELSLDIAAAYPTAARPASWRRTIALHRGRDVTVADAYELAAPAAEIRLAVLTPSVVRMETAGRISFREAALPGGRSSAAGILSYQGDVFEASVEEVPLDDPRLRSVWGASLRRVLFRAARPALRGTWTWQVTRGQGGRP